MNLAVTFVKEVIAVINHDGIPLVQKAIIRCSLALNTSGFREIMQLFQHVQDVIQHYQIEFAGSAVP